MQKAQKSTAYRTFQFVHPLRSADGTIVPFEDKISHDSPANHARELVKTSSLSEDRK